MLTPGSLNYDGTSQYNSCWDEKADNPEAWKAEYAWTHRFEPCCRAQFHT